MGDIAAGQAFVNQGRIAALKLLDGECFKLRLPFFARSGLIDFRVIGQVVIKKTPGLAGFCDNGTARRVCVFIRVGE